MAEPGWLGVRRVILNDGLEQDVFCVTTAGGGPSRVVPCMPYYRQFCRELITLEEIGMEVSHYLRSGGETIFLKEVVTVPYEKAKKKLFPKLVNKDRSKGWIKDVPHLDFLDMYIIFYIKNEMSDGSDLYIYNGVKDLVPGWTEDPYELFRVCMENSLERKPTLHVVERDNKGKENNRSSDGKKGHDTQNDPAPFTALVWDKEAGAAIALYPNVLKHISDRAGGDMYIVFTTKDVIVAETYYENTLPRLRRDAEFLFGGPDGGSPSKRVYLYRRDADRLTFLKGEESAGERKS